MKKNVVGMKKSSVLASNPHRKNKNEIDIPLFVIGKNRFNKQQTQEFIEKTSKSIKR